MKSERGRQYNQHGKRETQEKAKRATEASLHIISQYIQRYIQHHRIYQPPHHFHNTTQTFLNF